MWKDFSSEILSVHLQMKAFSVGPEISCISFLKIWDASASLRFEMKQGSNWFLHTGHFFGTRRSVSHLPLSSHIHWWCCITDTFLLYFDSLSIFSKRQADIGSHSGRRVHTVGGVWTHKHAVVTLRQRLKAHFKGCQTPIYLWLRSRLLAFGLRSSGISTWGMLLALHSQYLHTMTKSPVTPAEHSRLRQ